MSLINVIDDFRKIVRFLFAPGKNAALQVTETVQSAPDRRDDMRRYAAAPVVKFTFSADSNNYRKMHRIPMRRKGCRK